MELLERLRPRWRHPDPQVRAGAVRELGAGDGDRLATVARTDADAGVRRIAIKKLDDPAVLDGVAASDADPALRELAAERAADVRVAAASAARPASECEAALAGLTDERHLAQVAGAAAHESIRRAALARIAGDRALRDVVRHATDPAIRAEALDRIGDVEVLRGIATAEVAPDVALKAVERLTDPDALRLVAEHRTAARAVRERARTLLQALGADPALDARRARTRQLELFTLVAGLRAATNPLRTTERVRQAQAEWQALAVVSEPRPEIAERFVAACDALLAEAAGLLHREREQADERARHDAALAARAALCARVEALADSDALDALRTEWRALPPIAGEDAAALARRFAAACDRHVTREERQHSRDDALAALGALAGEAEQLAETGALPATHPWRALESRWTAAIAGLDGGDVEALQRRFASAGARLAERRDAWERTRSERQRANLERLRRLATQLQELDGAQDLSLAAARRALQHADVAIADLGPLPTGERRADWIERLTGARDALRKRLDELEETEQWRRWANTTAQEELIQRVEALLTSDDLAEAHRQLGQLQEDWARVATATPDKSQALWDRFRTARNQLRKRCDAWLAENLEKKRALCAQVAGAGDSTDWTGTTALIKQLQAEWKAIGPVPGRHAQLVWQEFREPCDRFFARRKAHFDRVDAERSDNARRKTALCERAEALADSKDWDATTEAIKKLQAEWKRTGPVPRAEGDALWQRFRAACDRFFDRSRRRDELEHEEAVAAAHGICERLEALAATPPAEGDDPAPIREAIDQAWTEWQRLGLPAGDEARAVHERLRAACEAIVAGGPERVQGTRLDPAATRPRREKLCARLEKLLETPAEAPKAASLQEMALALRERLAANTIAGREKAASPRQQGVARELERITASWTNLGPVLDDDGRALAARFDDLRTRVLATTR